MLYTFYPNESTGYVIDITGDDHVYDMGLYQELIEYRKKYGWLYDPDDIKYINQHNMIDAIDESITSIDNIPTQGQYDVAFFTRGNPASSQVEMGGHSSMKVQATQKRFWVFLYVEL